MKENLVCTFGLAFVAFAATDGYKLLFKLVLSKNHEAKKPWHFIKKRLMKEAFPNNKDTNMTLTHNLHLTKTKEKKEKKIHQHTNGDPHASHPPQLRSESAVTRNSHHQMGQVPITASVS